MLTKNKKLNTFNLYLFMFFLFLFFNLVSKREPSRKRDSSTGHLGGASWAGGRPAPGAKVEVSVVSNWAGHAGWVVGWGRVLRKRRRRWQRYMGAHGRGGGGLGPATMAVGGSSSVGCGGKKPRENESKLCGQWLGRKKEKKEGAWFPYPCRVIT